MNIKAVAKVAAYRDIRSVPPVANDLGPSYREKGWKAPAP